MLTGPLGSTCPRDSPLCVEPSPGRSPHLLCKKTPKKPKNEISTCLCLWTRGIASGDKSAYQVGDWGPFFEGRSVCCYQCPSFSPVADPGGPDFWKQGTPAGPWCIPSLISYQVCHIFRWLKTSRWNSEIWGRTCDKKSHFMLFTVCTLALQHAIKIITLSASSEPSMRRHFANLHLKKIISF